MKKERKELDDVAGWLARHRDEILGEWGLRINSSVDCLAVQLQVDVPTVLAGYFDEVQSLAEHRKLRIPPGLKTPMPFHSVRAEISALLLGEEAAAVILRKNWKGPEEDEVAFQHELGRVFHDAQRINAASACDQCRWELNERMVGMTELEKEMVDASE